MSKNKKKYRLKKIKGKKKKLISKIAKNLG
jgi:hypothetical protein